MSHKASRFRGRRLATVALMGVIGCGGVLTAAGSFAEPAKPAAPSSDRKVRLDFVQADINDVVKALSIQSGVNIVLMPSVKGAVTLRLTDLSLEDALKKVAAAVGSDVRRFESTYFLGSTTELRAMVARSGGAKDSLNLKFSQAGDVKELLQHAYPYLTVEQVGKSNTIVLAGTPEDVSDALVMARKNDVEPPAAKKPEPEKPQIIRDTYIVKYLKPAVLVETVGKAFPDVKVTNVDQTLVLEGPSTAQAQVAKLLTALDVKEGAAVDRVVRAYNLKFLHPNQASQTLRPLFPNLIVQAGFESYSPPSATFNPLSTETQLAFNSQGLQGATGAAGAAGGAGGGAAGAAGGAAGVDGVGSRSRTVILAGPAAEVEQATQVISSLDIAPQQVLIEARMVDISPQYQKDLGLTYNWSSLQFSELDRTKGATNPPHTFAGSFGRAGFNFDVTLNALETNKDARILARPNIAVVDGEQSSIFIGDILRYERLESVTAVGQTFTIETVPVGVALLCRPRINTDGKITLRVHPVVSTVTDFTGRNHDIPITASREADSTIVMQDGETIAIGGLLREEDLKAITKIPVLGDLPLLGQLFRNKSVTHNKSEVTIFLTARIIKS